jgi:hypothetical protein
VQIAKTTLLLALGETVRHAREPVVLQVFLANSLLVPRGSATLFESNFEVTVDGSLHIIDVHGLSSGDEFDRLISICDDIVGRYEELVERRRFVSMIEGHLPTEVSAALSGQLYAIYEAMKVARNTGRDSIWKFILQNSYKPVFLMHRFDIVVGNPPWLTFADIGSADYQQSLRRLANEYKVTPENKANIPHLEIAAIFLAHAVNYFLSENGGTVAFVLPRSFLSADQHHNSRFGSVKGMRLTEVWDLKDVLPLFRVPCCVLFAERDEIDRRHEIPITGIQGRSVEGRLPASQLHLRVATKYLRDREHRWFYSTLLGGKGRGGRSAITETLLEASAGANSYMTRFKQGATIVPRNFYFLEVTQKLNDDADLAERTVSVRTSALANADSKGVWKGRMLSGRVEGGLLFRTALARNVLPFTLIDPPLITLPVFSTERPDGTNVFTVGTSEDLLRLGYR